MSRLKFYILLFIGCISLLISTKYLFAGSDNCAYDTKQIEWNPSCVGYITTWPVSVCGEKNFVIQPYLFYDKTTGYFNSQGNYHSLPENEKSYQFQEFILIEYGITNKLEFDAQTVYQENYLKQNGFTVSSSGLGDSYFFLRYALNDEKKFLPATTLFFQIKAPTGEYQNLNPEKLGTDFMGSSQDAGAWDSGIGILLEKEIKPFVLNANAIFCFPQKTTIDGINTDYGKYQNYNLGIEWILPKNFNLMLEFNGIMQGNEEQNNIKIAESGVSSLTMAAGIGWSNNNNNIQTLLAFQKTLKGTNASAIDAIVFTVIYSF